MSRIVSVYYQLLLDCSYSMEPIWEKIQSQVGAHLERLEVELNLVSSTKVQLFARLIPIQGDLYLPKFSVTFQPLRHQLDSLLPSGNTALFDTLTQVIEEIKLVLDKVQSEQAQLFLIVLLSDGWDNQSTYSASALKAQLLALKDSPGSLVELWEIGPDRPILSGAVVLPITGWTKQESLDEDLAFCLEVVEAKLYKLLQN
jgi:hypothetical protein